MAEQAVMEMNETDTEAGVSRIYEIGYHVSPATKESEVEAVVAEVRGMIEKAGGRFLAEGAPSLTKLAYPIARQEGGKSVEYDRGYFGWIKFEAPIAAAQILDAGLKTHKSLMRSILFQTVREETRARFKTATLREVKRTDTIKSAPRQVEETSAPISEADFEKALEDITTE